MKRTCSLFEAIRQADTVIADGAKADTVVFSDGMSEVVLTCWLDNGVLQVWTFKDQLINTRRSCAETPNGRPVLLSFWITCPLLLEELGSFEETP